MLGNRNKNSGVCSVYPALGSSQNNVVHTLTFEGDVQQPWSTFTIVHTYIIYSVKMTKEIHIMKVTSIPTHAHTERDWTVFSCITKDLLSTLH